MMGKDIAPLPSEQYTYEGLPALDERTLHNRREVVFLLLSGLFLGTLAMLNILGVTRFIDLSFTVPLVGWQVPMILAVGVLPYPVTFLCTDFLCELYGERRANQVVWVGFGLNVWVAIILFVGGAVPAAGGPPVEAALPAGCPPPPPPVNTFMAVRESAFATISASMVAYLAAQLVDVRLFHFWKRVTGGKHLWLRNNGSTLVSQLVDSTAVILITHVAVGTLPIDPDRRVFPQLLALIAASYVFKLVTALVDTGPFYLGTRWFNRFLRMAPAGAEPVSA